MIMLLCLSSCRPTLLCPPHCRYHADEPGLAKQYPKQDKPYDAEEYDHQQYKAEEYRHDKPYSGAPAKEQYRKQYTEDPKKKYKKQYTEGTPEKKYKKQYKEETYDKAYGNKGPKEEEQYYKTSEKHSQQYRHKQYSPSEEPSKQYMPSKDRHYSKYKPSGPEYDSHEDAYDRYRDDKYGDESDYGCVKYEGSSHTWCCSSVAH